MSIEILKCECAIPPGRIEATTSKVVVAKSIYLIHCTVANKARYKKVSPVSHGLSIKNMHALFESILSVITLYTMS